MSVIDTSRFMALTAIAEADAVQAVYAAKWQYMFWRPMTAIRNGDIDGNPATDLDCLMDHVPATFPALRWLGLALVRCFRLTLVRLAVRRLSPQGNTERKHHHHEPLRSMPA